MVYRVMPPYMFDWGPSGGVFGEAHAGTKNITRIGVRYLDGLLPASSAADVREAGAIATTLRRRLA